MEDAEGFTAVRRKRRPLKAAEAAAEGAAAAEASVDSEPIEQIDESTEAALLRPMAAEAAAAAEAAEGAAEGGEDEASEGAEDMDQEADTSAGATGGAPQQQKGPRKGGPRKQLIDKEKEHKEEPFIRRLPVPQHRYTPLRQQWIELIKPLIMHMRLQVRMNLKRRCVELRAAPPPATPTQPGGALGGGGGGATAAATYMQKGEDNIRLSKGYDYIRAFLLGFEQRDCLALLRLDDMYLESFEIQDVKRLNGAHLSRCIGRLTGRNGTTRFAIENATRTRLVIAGRRIHILGSFDCIRLARHSICSLILGKPQGKVYCHLRTVAKRLSQRM